MLCAPKNDLPTPQENRNEIQNPLPYPRNHWPAVRRSRFRAGPVAPSPPNQGRLTDGVPIPPTAVMTCRFQVFTTLSGPPALSAAVTNAATSVSNGLFTVTLDFGANIFVGGPALAGDRRAHQRQSGLQPSRAAPATDSRARVPLTLKTPGSPPTAQPRLRPFFLTRWSPPASKTASSPPPNWPRAVAGQDVNSLTDNVNSVWRARMSR